MQNELQNPPVLVVGVDCSETGLFFTKKKHVFSKKHVFLRKKAPLRGITAPKKEAFFQKDGCPNPQNMYGELRLVRGIETMSSEYDGEQ